MNNVIEKIKESGQKLWPEEVCGLLFSLEGELESVEVDNISSILNRLNPNVYDGTNENSFSMNLYIVDKIIKEKEKLGFNFAGIYHTHPGTDNVQLSPTDIKQIDVIKKIFKVDYLKYLIVSYNFGDTICQWKLWDI